MDLSTKVPQGYVLKVAGFYECLKCGWPHVYNVEEHEALHNEVPTKADTTRPLKEFGEAVCAACGVNLTAKSTHGCFCAECNLHRPRELTLEQYLEILKLMRLRIWGGRRLWTDDSNVIGEKHTYCSWGFCSNDVEAFPKPEYHTWPFEYIVEGRVALLRRPKGWPCPLEREDVENFGEEFGCFYRCRIFQRKKGEQRVPLAEVLDRYDRWIATAEEAING